MSEREPLLLGRACCLVAALAAAMLAGCAVGPDYRQPDGVGGAPVAASFVNDSTTGAADADESRLANFWTLFGDRQLDDLVNEALVHNHDLRIAIANLRAVRALRQQSVFDLFPTVTADGSYVHALESQAQLPGVARSAREGDSVSAGFDASWELDFFGRVRRKVEAATADEAASAAGVNDAQVSIVAEVARNYCVLRGLQSQLSVAERNAENQKQVLALTQVRLEAGRGNELDTARAESQLRTTEATIPPLHAAIATTLYRLAVLTGRQPGALDAALVAPQPLPEVVAPTTIGSPAALLRRRPDVRIAERNLAASTARIGVAVGDLFPRVTFIGVIGYNARSVGDLGRAGSETYSFGPSISWAAFDLGRVAERIRQARAQNESQLAAYERTVLTALEETEGALVSYHETRERAVRLAAAASASEKAERLARQRFEAGLIDFLSVLQAESDLLAAQNAVAQTETDLATATIAIYKALGGGWDARSANS